MVHFKYTFHITLHSQLTGLMWSLEGLNIEVGASSYAQPLTLTTVHK